MMREAFHEVSPCRTMTTSVNSPAVSPPALEADDDIPRPVPGALTQRICGVGAAAGPVWRDAAAMMEEGGEGRKAAGDGDGTEGADGGGRGVVVGRRQSISGARHSRPRAELAVRESRDQKVQMGRFLEGLLGRIKIIAWAI
jgi:hypothetical protein